MTAHQVRLLADCPTQLGSDILLAGSQDAVVRVGDQAVVLGWTGWQSKSQLQRLRQALEEVLEAWPTK